MVKALLGREEVNPERPDNDGQTPLPLASWNGYDGVVKILLQLREVNAHKADNGSQTPSPSLLVSNVSGEILLQR